MEEGDKWRSSVTERVVQMVKEHRKRAPVDPKNGLRGPGGLIIFCEYIRGLDVIEMAIKKELGMDCIRRDGTVTGAKKKAKALQLFKDQANINKDMVLLTTGRSGGEGLNLPQATGVIQVAPSFNPFIDKQARARPLRRDQKGFVHIRTLLMRDSYEQRIDFMQFRKTRNAEGILDMDETAWQQQLGAWRDRLGNREGFMAVVRALMIMICIQY